MKKRLLSDKEKQRLTLVISGVIGIVCCVVFLITEGFSWSNLFKGFGLGLFSTFSAIMAAIGASHHNKENVFSALKNN